MSAPFPQMARTDGKVAMVVPISGRPTGDRLQKALWRRILSLSASEGSIPAHLVAAIERPLYFDLPAHSTHTPGLPPELASRHLYFIPVGEGRSAQIQMKTNDLFGAVSVASLDAFEQTLMVLVTLDDVSV